MKNFTLPSIKGFFWFSYLLLVIAASFINGAYDTKYWLILSAVLYSLIATFLLINCVSESASWRNIRANKYPIILLILMLVWLVLPLFVSVESSFNTYLFGNAYRPDWLQFNTSWSITPERTTWLSLSNLMVFSLFVFGLLLLDSRRRARQLVFVLLVIGLIHACLGIFAKYSGVYFVDKVSLDGHFDAARGLFVNRNHFAAFVSLCLISALAMQFKLLMMNSPNNYLDAIFKQIIRLSFLVLLIGIAALFLSESRGALLSFLLSFFFCVCLFLNGDKRIMSRRYFVIAGAMLVIVISLFLGEGMIDRFTNNALSLGERQTQWQITWQAIQSNLLLGYGGGSYQVVFQAMRDNAELRQVIYDQAHNDYLHIWLEQGFIGLALWLLFLVCTFKYLVRSYWAAKSTLVSSVLLAGIIVLIAILIQSFVDYPLQIISIRCYFFVILALLLSVPNIKHNS